MKKFTLGLLVCLNAYAWPPCGRELNGCFLGLMAAVGLTLVGCGETPPDRLAPNGSYEYHWESRSDDGGTRFSGEIRTQTGRAPSRTRRFSNQRDFERALPPDPGPPSEQFPMPSPDDHP